MALSHVLRDTRHIDALVKPEILEQVGLGIGPDPTGRLASERLHPDGMRIDH